MFELFDEKRKDLKGRVLTSALSFILVMKIV